MKPVSKKTKKTTRVKARPLSPLKAFRLKHKTTQQELSAFTGIAQGTLSKIESGIQQGGLEIFIALRRELGYDVNDHIDKLLEHQ
jgi:transcriptional regulator with XRE-family HTH domain